MDYILSYRVSEEVARICDVENIVDRKEDEKNYYLKLLIFVVGENMYGMDFTKFIDTKIVNGHLHFENISLIKETKDFLSTLDIGKLAIVSYAKFEKVNSNPQAICFKTVYPEETYILGGLDYSNVSKYPRDTEKELAKQLLKMIEIGFDGIKLLETKPDICKSMPFSIDDSVYNNFFALLEERRLPIIWHVADPEEFWDKNRISPMAKIRGWDYSDGTYPSKEEIYQKVERVLKRFPNLKVIFAHFYFLSADLPSLAGLLDKYPYVSLDITPGTEMFLNFSKNPEKTREFFIKYQDRIVFGDDTAIREEVVATVEKAITGKVFFIRNFLESEEEFLMPEGDENFLRIEDRFQGIKLPESVLKKIYFQNFLSIIAEKPSSLNIPAGKEECHRIGEILERKYSFPREKNFAYEAERFLSLL